MITQIARMYMLESVRNPGRHSVTYYQPLYLQLFPQFVK